MVDNIPAESTHLMKTGLSNANDALNLLYEASSRVSESSSSPWESIKYVQQGHVTAREVQTYIDYFLKTLLPMSCITTLPDLNQEEVLLTAVLTIASRYISLDSITRSFTIHDRLYSDLQMLINSLVWGGSANRSNGTVVALLLLTDWHPRAIHFPRHSPSGKSDSMSWMLLGLATTLEQELDAGDDVKSFIYIYTNLLATRLGHECVLLLPQAPPNDPVLELFLKLVVLSKESSKVLFQSSETTRTLVNDHCYESLLSHFGNLVEDWWREFEALPIASPMRELLQIEYEFTRISINSLALQCSLEQGKAMPSDELFVVRVVSASTSLLHIITAESFPLRTCPVRVFTRIISAAVFLLKSVAIPGARSPMPLLHSLISCMRANAVDDVHLILKYASMLEDMLVRVERDLAGHRLSSRSATSGGIVDWNTLFGDFEGMEFMDFLLLQG